MTAAHLGVGALRRRRNLDAILRPIVEAHGLKLIDSRPPGWFRTGPFPLTFGRIGTPETELLGISGQYWTYRIVRVFSANEVNEVWVRLYFQSFRLHEAEWRPPLATMAAAAS